MAKREKEVRIMFSQEEYDRIKQRAERCGMTVAAYIRCMGRDGQIIVRDYKHIRSHTQEIAKIRNSINRLVFTIDATNNYLPREIESIVNMMNTIFAIQNEVLRTIRLESGNEISA